MSYQSAQYDLSMFVEMMKVYNLELPDGISIAVSEEFAIRLENEISKYFMMRQPMSKGTRFKYMGVNCVVV